MFKGQWNESLIYFKNRPLAFVIVELVGRLGRVVKVPGIGYFINDPDIGKQVLKDPENFNSHDIGSVGYIVSQVVGEFALINMDGIKHQEWKVRLRELFAPKYLDEVFALAAPDIITELKRQLESGQIVDLAQTARTLIIKLSCTMAGIDLDNDGEGEKLYQNISKIAEVAGLGKQQLSDHEVQKTKAIAEEISIYARRSYYSGNARDHSIVQRLKELGFQYEEAEGLLSLILIAGTELITTAIPRIVALLIDTNQMKLLQQNPSLMNKTIDEGLRLVSPSTITLRAVANDCEIEGVKFKKNHRALVMNYTILKSKKYFKSPRQFDITRDINTVMKHTWFGGGPHFCLGFAMAQREIKIVLEALICIQGDLEIVKREYTVNKTFPGYSYLGIRLKSARV